MASDKYKIENQFSNIDKKFCSDIMEFVTKYGNEYRKIPKLLSKHPKDFKTLPFRADRMLRNIISNYIIERCNLMINIGFLKIPNFGNEGEMSRWLKENIHHLGVIKIGTHQGGIDYECVYRYGNMAFYPPLPLYLPFDIIYEFVHNKYMSIELEHSSKNFIVHKHPVDLVDMIICHKKNKDIYYHDQEDIKVPILELRNEGT